MAIKNLSFVLLVSGALVASNSIAANTDSSQKSPTEFELKVVSRLAKIRGEQDANARYAEAYDLASIMRLAPRDDLDKLSCMTVGEYVLEFEDQDTYVRALLAVGLGEIGGRARSSLPTMRKELANERARSVPSDMGVNPAATNVASYEIVIGKIESDGEAAACH